MQAGTQAAGKRQWFGVTENLNRLFGLIEDHGAVFAVYEVAFELLLYGRIEIAVDVAGQLANDALAIQPAAPFGRLRIFLANEEADRIRPRPSPFLG